MSEQVVEEVKPDKQVTDDYLKGYRAGFSRAYKKYYKSKEKKREENKLEIQVKKDEPQRIVEQKVEEEKKKEEPKKENNGRITIVTGIIIAVVLGLVIYFVFRARNTEPNQ